MIGNGQFSGEDNTEKQYEYCCKYLGEPFANGSSRIVFQLDDNLVLKLAMGYQGFIQNETEYNVFNLSKSPLLARILAADDESFTWLVSEAVLPAEEEDFEKIVGIPYYNTYMQDSQPSKGRHGDMKVGFNKYFNKLIPFGAESKICVDVLIDYMQGFDPGDVDTSVYDEIIENNKWLREINRLIKSLPLKYRMTDLFINNFGIVNRDGSMQIVILDSGA
jgi:hypothetical protein